MHELERARLIRRAGGVLTRRQLNAMGFSRGQLSRQVGLGLWRPAGPGILVHHSAPEGLATATRVAGLWRPDRTLTGPSAAVLRPHPAWADEDLGTQAMLIDARTGYGPWRAVRHPGARSSSLRGFSVASPFSTVVDLLRFLPERTATSIGAGAVRTGLATVPQLHETADRLSPLAGVQNLRIIASLLATGAHSYGEVRLHRALKRAGITGWIANYEVVIGGRRFVLDVAFPDERVYLEFDGVASHNSREAFESDRVRSNSLMTGRWRPILVTWAMLRDHEAELMAQIRAALSAAS